MKPGAGRLADCLVRRKLADAEDAPQGVNTVPGGTPEAGNNGTGAGAAGGAPPEGVGAGGAAGGPVRTKCRADLAAFLRAKAANINADVLLGEAGRGQERAILF